VFNALATAYKDGNSGWLVQGARPPMVLSHTLSSQAAVCPQDP
jgi:hypothetical protein